MSDWNSWDINPPSPGMKVIILCNDGCSSSMALIDDRGRALDAEDAMTLSDTFLEGSVWTTIPDSYTLAFMEITEDDWY